MSSIACLFCVKTGPPSAVNQHLREYIDIADSERNSKSLRYHNIDIILAFINSSKSCAKLANNQNSADRIIVLKEFASHITKHLKSNKELTAWEQRNVSSRTSIWWEKKVARVLEAYLEMGRDPEYLTRFVGNIVARSIRESLKDVDEDDSENDSDIPRLQLAANAAGGSQIGAPRVLAVSSAGNDNVPTANVELTMQYSGAQVGKRNQMRTGALGNGNNRAMRNDPGEGPSNSRPTRAAARRNDDSIFNISDDDEAGSPPGNGKITVGKRGQEPSARSVSAQIPLSRVPSSKPVRAASQGDASTSKRTAPRHHTLMAPFLRLDVYGLDNKMNQIPIAYGTSLKQAITKALAFAPTIIRNNNIPVRFEGEEKSVWAGEWTDNRWEEAMEQAKSQPVQIVLRLVLVGEE